MKPIELALQRLNLKTELEAELGPARADANPGTKAAVDCLDGDSLSGTSRSEPPCGLIAPTPKKPIKKVLPKTAVIEAVRQQAISTGIAGINDAYTALKAGMCAAHQQADDFLQPLQESIEQVYTLARWRPEKFDEPSMLLWRQYELGNSVKQFQILGWGLKPLVEAAELFGAAARESHGTLEVAQLDHLLHHFKMVLNMDMEHLAEITDEIPKEILLEKFSLCSAPFEFFSDFFVLIDDFKKETIALREIAAPYA